MSDEILNYCYRNFYEESFQCVADKESAGRAGDPAYSLAMYCATPQGRPPRR